MESINLDFYFYHIEKCAGTSLRQTIYNSFKASYADEQIHIPGINTSNNNNSKEFIAAGHGNKAYYKMIKIISEHANPGELSRLLGVDVSVRFSLSAFRKPAERTLSHYHFFDQDRLGFTSLMDMPAIQREDYVKRMGNLQTRRMSDNGYLNKAIAVVKELSMVIICERYQESISLLNKLNPFGVTFQSDIQQNVTSNRKKEDYKSLYTIDFIRSLDRYCNEDVVLYETATNRMEELATRLIINS